MKHLMILCLLLGSSSQWAMAETMSIPATAATPEPQTRFEQYYDRASEKFDAGAVNFLTGWTEVVVQPVEHFQQKKGALNRVGNSFVGTGKGLWNGTLDMVGGAANLLTFSLPQFQIPLPQGGVDLKKMGVTA